MVVNVLEGKYPRLMTEEIRSFKILNLELC